MEAGRSVSLSTAVPPDRIAKPGPVGSSLTSLFIGVALVWCTDAAVAQADDIG